MIELKKINKNFSNDIVIDDVSLTLKENHIYGIIGRNGSGKSVLFKIICGFIRPNSGEVIINNENIYKKNTFPKDTAALIEKPKFLDNLSGYENLKLLAQIKQKINDDKIISILKELGLNKEKDKEYKKYSLGTKQKLGIAQALMEEEKIIILDEPFTGLDDKSVDKVRELIKNYRSKDRIIIISSHIKEDIEILCDEIYRIDSGKIIKVSKDEI